MSTIILGDIGDSSHTNTMTFDGVDEFVQAPASAALNFASTDLFSISFWMNSADVTDFDYMVTKFDDAIAGDPGWSAEKSAGNLRFQLTQDSSNRILVSTSTSPIVVGQWHHVLWTYDGSTNASGVKLYFDGVEITGLSIVRDTLDAIDNTQTTANFAIANVADPVGPFPFEKQIDEVSVWNTELTSTDAINIYNNAVPTDLLTHAKSANLVAWYKMGEGAIFSGGNWNIPDLSTNSNDATSVNMEEADRIVLTGTVQLAVAPSINEFSNQFSMDFDGVDEFININGALIPLATTTVGTWSVWIKPTALPPSPNNNNFYFTFGDADGESSIALFLNTDGTCRGEGFRTGVTSWGLNTDSSVFSAGTWTHIALVQDGTSPVIYIDGIAVAQTFSSFSDKTVWFNDIAGLDTGRIGNMNRNNQGEFVHFNGNIDEVSLWNTNLSSTEITELYNSGIPTNLLTHTKSANLAAWWRMGEDAVFAAGNWTIPDASTNSNDGTSVNIEEGDRGADTPVPASLSIRFGPFSHQSLSFDGVDEVINIDGALNVLATTTKGTISAWYKTPSSLDGGFVIAFGDTDANEFIEMDPFSNGTIRLSCSKAAVSQWSFSTDNIVFTTSTWFHIVLVQDGTTARNKLYIDGSEVTAVTFINETNNAAWFNDLTGLDNGRIGALNSNNNGDNVFLVGNIDELSFWDTDLSSTEITELYNSGIPKNLLSHSKNANLVAWYRIGEGAVFDGSNWIIPDASVNSNDGTSVNMEESDRIEDAPA